MSNTQLRTDSLAHALLGAAHAVARVKAGTALPQALAAIFTQTGAPPQARGAIQDLAYRAMRELGRADALLALLADKPPASAELRGLLCCALALLAHEEGARDAPYADFTVVDQAVNAAASDPAMLHAKGMVNAVLRRFLRERAILLAQAVKHPPGRWNYPTWWVDSVRAAYPEDWESILRAGNRAPPLTLRVNRRKTEVGPYLETLAGCGMAATRVGPVAVRLERPVPVAQIPGFAEGMVSVQDAAAQLAAPLLDLQDGMRVLDACAAPGGKTGHMLESADIELLALDSDPLRLARIDDNLARLQLRATLKAGDAAGDGWWDGTPFDRILADVPCTASGIVRRHPDIRWLRRKEDTARLAGLSAQILDNLWRMLKPGGKLAFVTCSLWPKESELQAAAFAARNNAARLDAPGQLLPVADAGEDHDGLFYALFQKTGV
ncbi:MAG TPA: 16S rRNA (cytosine(967)-C(5))-methyltransferase RsmB [Noviherbaspirillum sp.]|uniref:16S rRNA (cytosine(967)-C(5))-methyltransferase RsmB n=1 Tax=Noviherbaspirillum sp. TaxID=1926288 RepID=UPI002D47E7D6|nr:16S rRNA (cytosine(967)-C(5))-methyltransferase RsmB [Noviherbaspirillum sp.]HYD95123.1 16S rRNA (cytosine(967)-C(5))-methyltransferase RsmB [Noviherbaspirillum sp.]